MYVTITRHPTPDWIGETVRITGRRNPYLTAVGRLGYQTTVLPDEVVAASLRAKLKASGLTAIAKACVTKWATFAVLATCAVMVTRYT